MRDELLGEFALDDSALTLTVATEDTSVKLNVRLEGATVAEAISTARFIVETLTERLGQARKELVREVLPIVNAGYLDPGEPPLSPEEFLRRAKLRGLSADVDGNTSFHFDDDDMLWGHRLVVDCDRDGLKWGAGVFG